MFLDKNNVKAHLQKQELANERCCRYYFDYYSNSVKRKSELYFERFKNKRFLKSTQLFTPSEKLVATVLKIYQQSGIAKPTGRAK